jgi:hypothetical protein
MIGVAHERNSQIRIQMAPYAINGCPSSFKAGTLEMDVTLNNETQRVMFQVCVPQTADDDLVLGLVLAFPLSCFLSACIIVVVISDLTKDPTRCG